MSSVETLEQRIKREDAELAKMRQEIQEVIDLAASRGIYFNLKDFPISKINGAGNAVSSPSRTGGPSESVEESQ